MKEISQQTKKTEAPKLTRVLGLWGVVFYGIILIQPIAAVGLFGIASRDSNGHMVLTLLIALVAMSLTAVSYGRMASMYPSAGSAYTYVGNGLNKNLGFMAGWAMFLDYLVVPVINTIYASITLQRLMPDIPYIVWVFLFVSAITLLNLRGIRTTDKSNKFLLLVMTLVIGAFIILAIKYILNIDGVEALVSTTPFYNPETFNFGAVMTATSFAVLTYIGFDGVTTLAEDVKNPKRNMLLAPVLVCLFTGVFSIIQIYLAQQVWPDYTTFSNIETAFFDVAERVGGSILFNAMAVILFVACFGSGLAGQVGAARLLFGMGRDGVLPKKPFSTLSMKNNTPVFNIIFMGVLTFFGSLFLGYQGAAELLNFGAFLAFMGVNLAAFRQFFFLRKEGEKRNLLWDAVLPILGFLVCFAIWINLPSTAMIMGGIWFLIGLVYLIIRVRFMKVKNEVDFMEL
ncbi:APC family permease [Arenibacter sp. F26102]|uniref:APC family permease n=1 Tax=Arenibacter sp. F26102 TaxID=2926416 RepID=UPI001FF495D5|nr:APC family permease [Arenibacter sp. F26102]MCK0148024.1 APC family permease [Arenibacter sp. F26102]